MDELFGSTFQYLRETLVEQNQFIQTNVSSTLGKTQYAFDSSRIQNEVIKARKHLSNCCEQNDAIMKIIKQRLLAALESGIQHELFASRLLDCHQTMTDRRLRELTYEIFGEYNKSFIRAERRQDYLKLSFGAEKIQSVHSLQWKRFTLKFLHEISRRHNQSIVYSDSLLCKTKNSLEYLALRKYLNKHLDSSTIKNPHITTIVRIGRTRIKSDNTHTPSSSPQVIASTYSDLKRLLHLLQEWMSPPSSSSNRPTTATTPLVPSQRMVSRQSSRQQQVANKASEKRGEMVREIYSMRDYVSLSSVEWMTPSGYHEVSNDMLCVLSGTRDLEGAVTANNSEKKALELFSSKYIHQNISFIASERLYFCLEERSCASLVNTSQLQDSYMSFTSSPHLSAHAKINIEASVNLLKYIEVSVNICDVQYWYELIFMDCLLARSLIHSFVFAFSIFTFTMKSSSQHRTLGLKLPFLICCKYLQHNEGNTIPLARWNKTLLACTT